ncbi:MAG: AAA family ATPase, partial [Actinomycetes bacterium]
MASAMVPRRLALLGAECSGKTTLAQALARSLPAEHVPEVLRAFVNTTGRPPTAGEQRAIMTQQIDAEQSQCHEALAAGVGWICADPCPLMTAVYSIEYFGDDSLLMPAVQYQRTDDLTLWCDID